MERLQPYRLQSLRTLGALVQVSSTAFVLGAASDLLVPFGLLPGQI
jgi:hypothetical protein